MLNREEILIKLMQILDFDMNDIKLKQSAEKKRFITFEESPEKTKEHIELIFKTLNLDEANSKLIDVFGDLIYLYENIESQLLFRLDKSYEKKLNWILLKRLVIPYLAYRFANIDVEYDERIDKGMSGGVFWYLPDLRDYNYIKMPIETLMKWWLDLYGKGLDSLCNEIDKESKENQAFKSKDILKPWLYKNVLPDRKSLELYLSENINYTGVFEKNATNRVSVEFERAKNFIEKKGLTAQTLNDEIPEKTLVGKILENKQSILKKEKFIQLVSDRWQEPNKKSLISKFVIARAVQDVYGKLVKYFDINNDSMKVEENKVLQLIYQYGLLYNLEITKDKGSNEYLSPFYSNDFNTIITTIHSDINIELQNPSVEKYELEEAYLIMANYAKEIDNYKLFEKSVKNYENFHKYFMEQSDNYEMQIAEYKKLNDSDFLLKLQRENNFDQLWYLFHSYKLKEYDKEEKICFQISKVAKNREQNIKVLSLFLTKYTDIVINNNINQYMITKNLIDMYLKLSNEISSEFLMFQIFFYFKSKEFEESLKFCDKYFNEFIENKNKEEIHNSIVFLAAYCADSLGDDKKLKKYNKYLKKFYSVEFENQKSLPFPIYFYE